MRPNRNRRKTSIYLGEEDHQRIWRIKTAYGDRTDAAAIRRALEVATAPMSADLGLVHRVLEWAEHLPWKTPKDTAELHQMSKALYREVCHRAAAKMPPETQLNRVPQQRRSPVDPEMGGVPESDSTEGGDNGQC